MITLSHFYFFVFYMHYDTVTITPIIPFSVYFNSYFILYGLAYSLAEFYFSLNNLVPLNFFLCSKLNAFNIFFPSLPSSSKEHRTVNRFLCSGDIRDSTQIIICQLSLLSPFLCIFLFVNYTVLLDWLSTSISHSKKKKRIFPDLPSCLF